MATAARKASSNNRQTSMRFRTWGGKRKGAGRPAKGKRSSERHETRKPVRPGEPVHVTLRVERAIGSLRRRHVYRALQTASFVTARREDFHIVHYSVQGNHVHLIVEAQNRTRLARGLQGFQISAARNINRAITRRTGDQRKGRVFCDRYHARIVRKPRDVRNTLSYVLNNWRHHELDQHGDGRLWQIDPYSSAELFDGWKERAHALPLSPVRPDDPRWIVWRPRAWLLREGWRRHGLISMFAVPGDRP